MSGIFPHNSDKCHCPECNTVRQQVTDIANSAIGKERLACNREGVRFGNHALQKDYMEKLADTRAEMARRRSKMHADAATERLKAMDIANRPSKGLQHDAADSVRYLRAVCGDTETFEERRDRVLGHTHHSQYVLRAGDNTAWSRRTYYDKFQNQMFHWQWMRGRGWMKRATNGRLFGPRYRKVRFLPDGFTAWAFGSGMGAAERYTDTHGNYAGEGRTTTTATEHTVTKKVGNLEHTVTDRVETLPSGDVFGWQHQFKHNADGTIQWFPSRWKEIGTGARDYNALARARKYGGSLAQSVIQMSTPSVEPSSWVKKLCEDVLTPAWTPCNPEQPGATYRGRLNYAGAVSGPRLNSGSKTGKDAENNPINLEGCDTMISALKLSLLTFRAAHPTNIDYPMTPSTQRNVRSALRQLHEDQLIINENDKYVLSDRGRVLVEAMQNLALPTRPEPKWVMPTHTK